MTFATGQRVRISSEHEWVDGTEGTISARPPRFRHGDGTLWKGNAKLVYVELDGEGRIYPADRNEVHRV